MSMLPKSAGLFVFLTPFFLSLNIKSKWKHLTLRQVHTSTLFISLQVHTEWAHAFQSACTHHVVSKRVKLGILVQCFSSGKSVQLMRIVSEQAPTLLKRQLKSTCTVSPLVESNRMFSPCRSPSPSTYPIMLITAVVRAYATRALYLAHTHIHQKQKWNFVKQEGALRWEEKLLVYAKWSEIQRSKYL